MGAAISAPIAAVQTEYSLLYREEAEETLQTTRALGIGFMAYSPLGRGLLTGAVRSAGDVAGDRRAEHPRFVGDNLTRNLGLLERVEALAREKACTPGQLVLAWLLAQGEDVIPIPGTKNIDRLKENLGAADIVLTRAELDAIAEVIPAGAAAGTRYPAGGMAGVFI